jgi:hypothetical protein
MTGGGALPNYFWEHHPARNARLAPELYAIPGQACFFTVRAWGQHAPFANSICAQIAVECLLEQRAKSGC